MKKITRFVKDANLNIRVDKKDLERWKKKAKAMGCETLTQYVIQQLNFPSKQADL
jgi:predicted DNA binding CopG/RHH family protein